MTTRSAEQEQAIFEADQLLLKVLESQPNLLQQFPGSFHGTQAGMAHAHAIQALRRGLIEMYTEIPGSS